MIHRRDVKAVIFLRFHFLHKNQWRTFVFILSMCFELRFYQDLTTSNPLWHYKIINPL